MELFNYLLKVSACSVLFFAFYLLVLRKLTFFRINRFYLLFSVLLSFVIPALQITVEREVVAGNAFEQPIAVQDVDLGGPAFQDPITVGTGPVAYEVTPFDWYGLLPYLYGFIVFALLSLTAWRIYQLLKHTTAPVKEINGLKLVAKQSGFTNCSFFNYVFIDEQSLTQSELAVLLAHEEVHAKQYHSIDKLLLMIAKAFLFFNPVIYLYDKALEQTHEYEADEATSKNIGTDIYATLLLKLAVSKSSNPLIHNFVKSPIKQRIKMLFNSKSKNMKKLAYLLALPIGLGLIWGFTVKITHRVKPFVQQQPAFVQDTLIGKTFKGKVVGFEKRKLEKVFNLQVGNTLLPISDFKFKEKVEIGDEMTVTIGGKSSGITQMTDTKGNRSTHTEKPSYMVSAATGADGKSLLASTEHYAFLYEANRARYAWSKIKSIEKDANGTIHKIVLNDKNGFVINLNVAAQQFKSNDFNKGDEIVVKFIGEKLTGKKTFTTDKMIALYSWPKKYELINKELYPKFYEENGKQKVYNKQGQAKITQEIKTTYTPVKSFPKPILKSSSEMMVNNKTKITYLKDGVMKLFNGELTAKEIEINEATGIIIAKQAKFKDEKWNVIESEQMTFNTQTGAFAAKYTAGKHQVSAAYELISKMNLKNSDSLRVAKIVDDVIILSGKVKMNIDDNLITGKVMSVKANSNILTAHFSSLKRGNEPAVTADKIEFDLVTKEAKYTNLAVKH